MHASIRAMKRPGPLVPDTLLGHNLEMAGDTAAGLLAERMDNPRFTGLADAQTGVAPGWQPGRSRNLGGLRFELTPGMGLGGRSAQLVHNYGGRADAGLVQTRRWLRAGETLEVTLWARAQHHPVTLRVGLRPLAARAPVYCEARIPITHTYWHEYRATLRVPRDDMSAVFFCFLEEPGLVWLDQMHLWPEGADVMRADVREAFRSLKIPVLRFPGGSVTGGYHWRHGTGAAELRPTLPDPVFKWQVDYTFGTDEYLALCAEQHILPQITVNIGTGTPIEAEEWAAYVARWFREHGLALPPMYWQIGNEQYGAWELGNMPGELYADLLRAFVPGVRRAYPNARIIALGPEMGQGLDAHVSLPWRAPVLERAGDLVDVLALQWYGAGWNDDPAQELLQALRGANTLAQQVSRAIRDCRERKLPTRLAVTEWNYWRHASHYDDLGFLEPYDVLHGLFAAAVLHRFVRLVPDLELANFYHLINPMGIFISRGPDLQETPLAALFRLYRPAFPGRAIPLEISAPDLEHDLPALDAIATENEGGRWLFLVNIHPTESITVDLGQAPICEQGQALVGTGLRAGWHTETISLDTRHIIIPAQSIARLHGKPGEVP